MASYYYFSNLLVFTINVLFFGTLFAYLLFYFFYKNQYQNIVKHDIIYNFIKIILLLSLGTSFLLFLLFLFFYYNYCRVINNYSIFTFYYITPKLFYNSSLISFEYYVDLFGIILLFLGYFVGILSLLALDNRVY